MTTITAKIIKDSISAEGVRLTTMELVYPRFIHAEFMTHRMFSRNASSSRAIPVEKMIERVIREPAEPVHWGLNQPGMQADNELPWPQLVATRAAWLKARDALRARAVAARTASGARGAASPAETSVGNAPTNAGSPASAGSL